MPSRTLMYLAGLTPRSYDAEIVDELVDDVDFETEADMIALTGMLRNILRAFDIAEKFCARGKKVIIGGTGAYSIWRALKHFYSLPMLFKRALSSDKDSLPSLFILAYFYYKIRKGVHPLSAGL
ncbi:MAG: hypothetical protein PHP17_03590 [Candidatus Omnitrophica bacterium]|nr:hypothetical protein [Candidatus Omnitrophota bacterium]